MQKKIFIKSNLTWKILLALGVFTGVGMQLVKFGTHMIRYYTTQSNLVVGIFMVCLLYQYRKRGAWTVQEMRLKGGITMVILLTGLVYHFMLRPIANPANFWTLDNLLLHYFVPFGTVIDWLLFDKPRCYKWWDPFWWTLFPIAYAISAVLIGVVTRIPIGDNPEGPFPYFFLNVDKFGYTGVLLYSLALAVGFMLFSYGLVFVKQIVVKRR